MSQGNIDDDVDRTLSARAAALQSWAHTDDWARRTRPARETFLRRFDDQVDPERKLSADERNKRADRARRAYFTDLARKSAQVRRQECRAADVQLVRDELAQALDALDDSTGELQ